MNIHISKLINNQLKDDEIKVNIEISDKNKELENIIPYIEEFDKRKIVVFDGYNMMQINTL